MQVMTVFSQTAFFKQCPTSGVEVSRTTLRFSGDNARVTARVLGARDHPRIRSILRGSHHMKVGFKLRNNVTLSTSLLLGYKSMCVCMCVRVLERVGGRLVVNCNRT